MESPDTNVVKESDELAIRFGQKIVTVKINFLNESTEKEDMASMYMVLKEEKLDKVEIEFVDDED